MMAYSTVPTVAPGDAWSAAQHNTYIRDNFAALWKGTANGDMDYYTGLTDKARLALGAVGTILMSNGTIPTWGDPKTLAGILAAIGVATFNPDADYGGTWGDVAGASVSLTLPAGKTYTVFALASLTGYSALANSGRGTQTQVVIDGNGGGNYGWAGSESTMRNQPIQAMHYRTGIASGARVCKVQAQADTGTATHVTLGKLLALAFTE